MTYVTIYHYPDCGTSRNTLALIRNAGVEPTVIEYLKNPPDRATLQWLISRMGIHAREFLREKGTPYAELGLAASHWTDDELVDHMLSHTRSPPGPVGLYIVSVGYFVVGVPGAIAGWLAMITPALLIIPLLHFVGRRMENPRVKSILQTVVIASAGLLFAASIPLAQEALTDSITIAIAIISLALRFTTKLDTLWIILGAAVCSLSAASLGVLSNAV